VADGSQSTKKRARFRQFQEKADEAGLIIFVLSNDFAKSHFTREQVLIFDSNMILIVMITAATVMIILFLDAYKNAKTCIKCVTYYICS